MGTLIGIIFGAGLSMVLWNQDSHIHTAILRLKRRPSTINFAWPAFIEDVASGVRAGLGLPQATWQAGSRLPVSAASVFSQAELKWSGGDGFEDALAYLLIQFPNASCEQFVHTIELAHRQGGRAVSTLLSQMARDLRTQQQLIHEVKGRQAVTATSAKVAVAAPWVVLVMTATRSDVRETYSTSSGLVVLVIVFGITAGSYLLMKKIAEIPELEVLK